MLFIYSSSFLDHGPPAQFNPPYHHGNSSPLPKPPRLHLSSCRRTVERSIQLPLVDRNKGIIREVTEQIIFPSLLLCFSCHHHFPFPSCSVSVFTFISSSILASLSRVPNTTGGRTKKKPQTNKTPLEKSTLKRLNQSSWGSKVPEARYFNVHQHNVATCGNNSMTQLTKKLS